MVKFKSYAHAYFFNIPTACESLLDPVFIGEVPMSIKVGRVCSVGPAGQAGLWEMGIVGHSPGDFAGSDGDMSSVDLG